ncbi:MAG: hypothetical protein HY270_07305 [Deltaproteobacteria bacterium]|nr:hypothetical protein [Deltaproteobacteria bacterium]
MLKSRRIGVQAIALALVLLGILIGAVAIVGAATIPSAADRAGETVVASVLAR